MSRNTISNPSQSSKMDTLAKELKRKTKWKEILYFSNIIRESDHKHGSIENALWFYGKLEIEQFLLSILHEFKFSNAMIPHLTTLYHSLDNFDGRGVDWRDIVASLKILFNYRLLKEDPIELLSKIFDVYSTPVDIPLAKVHKIGFKNVLRATYIKEFRIFRQIFMIPVIEELDEIELTGRLDLSFHTFFNYSVIEPMPKITREMFQEYLESEVGFEVMYEWIKLSWKLLPPASRLTVYDEAQMVAVQIFENITVKYRWKMAEVHYDKVLVRECVKEWKLFSARGKIVRDHRRKVHFRKKSVFFYFWMKHIRDKILRNKKRFLADVMGDWAIKIRTFDRIRRYGVGVRKTRRAVTLFESSTHATFEAFGRLREFRRIRAMRQMFHRWWNQCVVDHNNEIADRYRFIYYTWKLLHAWYTDTQIEKHNKAQETIALENQKLIADLMIDAEEAVRDLAQLEKARKEKVEQAIKEEEKKKKVDALERTKLMFKMEAQKTKEKVLNAQKKKRRKRIKADLALMKKEFTKEWNVKIENVRQAAEKRTTSYLKKAENGIAIQLAFEKLKRTFHDAPVEDETIARDKIISNPANILFLFLHMKMYRDGVSVDDVISMFGEGKKYLTRDEFRNLANSLKSPIQSHVIERVFDYADRDRNNVLFEDEIQKALEPVPNFGVMGSIWRYFVHPAHRVICYRNFKTKEVFLEDQVTDEILMQVHHANYFGEEEYEVLTSIRKEKSDAWINLIQNYMARRIQRMIKAWRARRKRRDLMWKVVNRKSVQTRAKQKRIYLFITRAFVGFKARIKFNKQLHMIYEKAWDIESGRMFWMNHATKSSSWERPKLLWRYGDVETPSPWVSITDGIVSSSVNTPATTPPTSAPATRDGSRPGKQKVNFWNCVARRSIPRKPDGYLICHKCEINLAVRRCIHCVSGYQGFHDNLGGMLYCYLCHKDTHENPMGFCQKTAPNENQKLDGIFLDKLQKFLSHEWRSIDTIKCNVCNSENGGLLAYAHCYTCKMNMCRICFRRFHAHDEGQKHQWIDI